MKLALSWLLVISLVILQVTFGRSLGLIFSVPLSVIAIIVLASFVNTEQLVYMGFASGFLLDLTSGRNFGINIFYLLFVAIFCKLVMHFGQREYSWLNVILLTTLLTTLHTLILYFFVYSPDQYAEAKVYILNLFLTDLVSIIWTIILYIFAMKIYQSDINIRLNKNMSFISNITRGTK